MMIVPFIFRLITKEKIKYKKGKFLCFLNSFVIYILFLIPNLITILKRNDNFVTIDPVAFSKSLIVAFLFIAIIYYFINMFLFVDNKNN